MKDQMDKRTRPGERRFPTNRELVLTLKKVHDFKMQGKKTILVPHPTLNNCFIERIVEEED